MNRALCISVEFLNGTFHGQGDVGPEWPPSPLRIFQAITAAAAALRPGVAFEREAAPSLRWLASLGAPTIVAPPARPSTPVRIAVPNNDLDIVAADWQRGREPKRGAAELKTMKTVAPMLLPDPCRVYYLWHVDETADPHIDVLRTACRSVSHVGWGTDLAACNLTLLMAPTPQDVLGHGEVWEPIDARAANRLRVPRPSALDALQHRHTLFLNRLEGGVLAAVPPLDPQAYERRGYTRDSEMPARPYAAFELRTPDGSRFRPFDPVRSAVIVAAMVRHALADIARRAGWPTERVNVVVHGHTPDGTAPGALPANAPRFGYLPIPTVESYGEYAGRYRLSMIRRVVVAGSIDLENEIRWVEHALAGSQLFDERTGAAVAVLQPVSGRDWVIDRYSAPSSRWLSSTPVLLPGYDSRDPRKTERLIRKALQHAGVPRSLAADADLGWSPAALLAGADAAWRYRRPASLTGSVPVHLEIGWRGSDGQPIARPGPLAIGSGRFRGLGVMVGSH